MTVSYNRRFEDILPHLDEEVDIFFCDFPYMTTKCKWDTPVDLGLFWKEAWRLLKPNGVVVCTAQFPFAAKLAMSQIKYLRYEWIWEKTQATGHLNAKKMPMKAHENILVFYKKLPTYNPQKTYNHMRKVSSSHSRKGCIIRTNQKQDYLYGKSDEMAVQDYDSTDRYPRSVLKFPSDKQKEALHPTQKPLALLEYLIKTYTNEGDLVIDPVAGVFTTGVACEKLGRDCILIEKEEKFYNIGLNRIRQCK